MTEEDQELQYLFHLGNDDYAYPWNDDAEELHELLFGTPQPQPVDYFAITRDLS